MRERLVIRVKGVPASCLLPNKQRTLSHRVWGPEAKALRESAYWEAFAAYQAEGCYIGGDDPDDPIPAWFDGPVRLRCVIAWPKGRKACDFQAAVHALKAAVDGLEDASWISNDSQVVGMDVTQIRADKDDAAGWVEMEMSAVERAATEEERMITADSTQSEPFTTFQREVGEWGKKTFPKSTPISIVNHLRREVAELEEAVRADPDAMSVDLWQEAADCYLLLLHLAYRGGFDLAYVAGLKFALNRARTWGSPDEEGVSEHIESRRSS